MGRDWTARLTQVCQRYQVDKLLIVHKIGKRSRQVRWRCGVFDSGTESPSYISIKRAGAGHPFQLDSSHATFPKLLQEWRGVPTAKICDHLSTIWLAPLDADSQHICGGLINTGKAMCPDSSHIWLSLKDTPTPKRKAACPGPLEPLLKKKKKSRYETFDDHDFSAFMTKLASEVQPLPPNFRPLRPISQGDTAWSDEELVKACHRLFNDRRVEKAAVRGMNLSILQERHSRDWLQFMQRHKLGNLNTARHQMELYRLIAEQGHQKLLLLPPGRVTDLYYNICNLRSHLSQTNFWKLQQ